VRARRTEHSTKVYRLPGGTEDNDLWVYEHADDQGNHITSSVWVPSDEERAAIAAGENIRLNIWGRMIPPVMIDTTPERIGKKPEDG